MKNGYSASIPDILSLVAIGVSQGDTGVAFVGGEPFDQPSLPFVLEAIKEQFPKLKITIYTGYLFETLLKSRIVFEATVNIDYLIDGPYLEPSLVQEEEYRNLAYKGSPNQRIIDVQKTIASHNYRVVLKKWKNMIAMIPGHGLSGPPNIMALFNETLESECGKFEPASV